MREYKITRLYLIQQMTNYLENMCAYFAVNDRRLARYYAGKADAVRDILVDWYFWDFEEADEHVKNMFDIMDEEWDK